MRLLLGGTLHVVVILLAAATNVEGRRHKLTAGGRKWERRYRLKQKPNRALSAHKPLKAVYPAGVAVRFPGEFEPVASVTVAYDSWGGDIERIAAALINETDVDIFMLDWPQQFVTDQIQNAEQVKLIPHDVDALWTRDYGPVGVLLSADSSEEESLAIVDMEYIKTRQKDDAIPCSLAELYADWSPCYRMEVEMDGGNLMGDGYGNLFMTSATYDWNPDLTVDEVHENFKRFFGVHTIHVFEYAKDDEGFPLDGTGHIDMMAKLLDPCTLILVETEEPEFHRVIEKIAAYFGNLTCPEDREYDIYRVPGWFVPDYFDFESNTTFAVWYTYANSLIVNDVIFMPGYESGNDAEAAEIYRKASPCSNVVVVRTDTLITGLGSVHCVTKQLPAASNSPSLFPLMIANVTCAEITGPPGCDLDSVSETCQELYFDSFRFAVSEKKCEWNALYFNQLCCTPAMNRSVVVPQPMDGQIHEILIYISFDDAPQETSWFVLDASNSIVASSEFYGSKYADDYVEIFIDLPVGEYDFVLMDTGGNGIDSCCTYVDDLTEEIYLVYFNNYFEYHESKKFYVYESNEVGDEDNLPASGNTTFGKRVRRVRQ